MLDWERQMVIGGEFTIDEVWWAGACDGEIQFSITKQYDGTWIAACYDATTEEMLSYDQCFPTLDAAQRKCETYLLKGS